MKLLPQPDSGVLFLIPQVMKAVLPESVTPTITPGFVPAGTAENSPPFQRWENDSDKPTSPVRDGRSGR